MSRSLKYFLVASIICALPACMPACDCVDVTVSSSGAQGLSFFLEKNGTNEKWSSDPVATTGQSSTASYRFTGIDAKGDYTAGFKPLMRVVDGPNAWVPLPGWEDRIKTWVFHHTPSSTSCTTTEYNHHLEVSGTVAFERSYVIGADGLDPPPTTIVSEYPAAGSTGHRIWISISAFPSRPLDCDTVFSGQISVIRSGTGAAVAGQTRCLEQELRFVPDGALEYGATYEASVQPGALDVAGLPIPTRQWSFSTFERPVVVGTTPPNGAQGVSPNTGISVSFSKPMECNSFYGRVSVSPGGSGGAVSCSGGAISYSGQLAETTGYTVSLASGIYAADGSELEPYSFSFSTMLCPRVKRPGCWKRVFGRDICFCWSDCWIPQCP